MNWLFIAAHFQTTINQGIKMKKIFHVGHNDKQRKTHDIINGKKVAKKEYLKELASLYRNCIDKRAYDALMSFDIKNPFTMD